MDGGWYSNNFHIYIGFAILGRLKIRFSIFLWVFRKMNICLFGWFLTTHQPLWVISIDNIKLNMMKMEKVKNYKIK